MQAAVETRSVDHSRPRALDQDTPPRGIEVEITLRAGVLLPSGQREGVRPLGELDVAVLAGGVDRLDRLAQAGQAVPGIDDVVECIDRERRGGEAILQGFQTQRCASRGMSGRHEYLLG